MHPVEEDVQRSSSFREPLMPVCPAVPCDVVPAAAKETGLGLLGKAGMVAVRVADLASPAGAGLGKDGRTALIAAGAGRGPTGEGGGFLKPVRVPPSGGSRRGPGEAAGRPRR